MIEDLNRRTFLGLGVSTLLSRSIHTDLRSTTPANETFFRQDPALVLEMVSVAHNNLARVRELIDRQPALAKAGHDWGFGDWETALDAAAHVGQRDIAELLIKSGARPTIFSAAMLGQLPVVQSYITASPGIQRNVGPHSITLLSHARAGGPQAKPVLDYLAGLGDADPVLPTTAHTTAEKAKYTGNYAFGDEPSERLAVGMSGDTLFVERVGVAKRTIRYVGNHEFRPAGAEWVRIRFEVTGTVANSLQVFAPELLMSARRI